MIDEDASRFQQRFSEWGRYGISAFEAANRHRPDDYDRPTLESALALALIVLVRTFLSFPLEIELHGCVSSRIKPMADDSDGLQSR